MMARRDQQGMLTTTLYNFDFWGRRLSHESRSIREITIQGSFFAVKQPYLIQNPVCPYNSSISINSPVSV
jgi:hypothetical protein